MDQPIKITAEPEGTDHFQPAYVSLTIRTPQHPNGLVFKCYTSREQEVCDEVRELLKRLCPGSVEDE